MINGLAFTIPRKTIADRSDEARAQRELEEGTQSASSFDQLPAAHSTNDLTESTDRVMSRASVTEHTTHHLKPNKS